MQTDNARKTVYVNLVFHAAYSVCHIGFGIAARSWWFFTIGIYYALLSAVRFAVLRSGDTGPKITRFTGSMLMMLSLSLVGTVVLSFVKERGTVFPLVVMLAIAVYTFVKMTLAVINRIKVGGASAKLTALRNISFADAFTSVFSLQRSMLVSFEGMSKSEIRIMNAATGGAVCILVFVLGLYTRLVCGRKNATER